MANILIVDDERPIRRILSVLLQERRHRVTDVGSGEEVLAALPEAKPDLVLLDLKLPGIDGLETLKRLRALHPRLDVVMMTAHGTISSAVEAMRRGAFDYVTKPFDNDELLMIVDRALEMRRLSAEVESLREDLEARYGFSEIVGVSRELQEVFRMMAKVVRVDVTVLVTGESGTGKELVARAIHRRSPRSQGPFVAVNCSAIPQTLVESEFFGHEKGAFTDARETRLGKFEQADGGSLFLDEVGDLALDAQAKLLRALQERQIHRIGARAPRPVDVRVIAATNKDLKKESREGRFREDLYWRLNVVHIRLPALRERRADLPILIDHFVDRFNRELGLAVQSITPDARQLLCEYQWPGNVRELENTLCQAMILCEEDTLTVSDLPGRVRGEPADGMASSPSDLSRLSLADAVTEATERLEKVMILSRLAEHRGSRTATAESLGISRKTLFNKMRQYGLTGEEIEEGAQ
ncbi:MAG TPA: sigma-54 dependent transcriptional regulator [Thermoanaerobaculia bacterium]|jgi:nitrogen regulation protein NR(I)